MSKMNKKSKKRARRKLQRKKQNNNRHNKNFRVCEKCGNGGFAGKGTFKCKFCGHVNKGIERVTITYGRIEEDR